MQILQDFPALNTSAVVTIPADSTKTHVIHWIAASYLSVPTGGRMTITDGGATIWDHDVTIGGTTFFHNLELENSAPNQAMVVTLAAGGLTVKSKLVVGFD